MFNSIWVRKQLSVINSMSGVRDFFPSFFFLKKTVKLVKSHLIFCFCSWRSLFFACEDFGENIRPFIYRLRSFLFEVEISSRTLIPHLRPGSVHSGSAGWDDRCRMFPNMLRVSSYPDRFRHYAWTAAQSAHSDFVGSRMYACLGTGVFYMPLW